MKIKVSELSGSALDWAVAKLEDSTNTLWQGLVVDRCCNQLVYSEDWGISGPIIERENISTIRCDDEYQNFPDKWMADRGANSYCESTEHQQHEPMLQFSILNNGSSFATDGPFYGPTPLIAAMRCYVASKTGTEVDIPGELL